MGRDVKDEEQGATVSSPDASSQPQAPVSQGPQMATPKPPTVQIAVTESIEKQLVDIVMEDWRAAKVARDKRDYGLESKGGAINFDKWLKGLRDLYNARREPKDIPWKYCSNRGLRLAASILDMIHSRLYPSVLNEELLRWRPGEKTDQAKVERITKLMHWWCFVHSRVRSFFDIWVKQVAGYGDGLTETSWKVQAIDKGETIQEPIVDEMGQQLTNPDGTPAISTSRAISLLEKTASKVYAKEDVFLQEGSTDIQTEPVILKDCFKYRELEEGEASGKFVNVTNLLRSKINWDKPDVTGLTSDEEERIKSIRIRNVNVEILKAYLNFDADGDGFAEDIRIIVAPEYELYLGGIAVRDLTKSGKRPIDFTKFDNRIENPDENSGEGVLEKIKELSEEIDAIFNQMTDANTIGVLRPFFYDPGGDVDAPVLKLGPNKGTPISDPTRNVMFPDIRIQTDQMILAIRLVLEFVERLTAASSYVMGKESEIVGGSGTATRTQAIVQSAEQRFAMPSERLREGAARIIQQHLDILQLNIPPGLENRVLGEDGEPIFDANELTAEGITGEFDAYLLMDPSMGSQQTERELASMMYSILLQNMIVGTDPVKIYKITADFIKAYGKDPEEYLGPAPDSDSIDSPEDENTLIIQGDFKRVRAQITENHILHIQKHMELLESPTLASLPPHLVAQVTQFTEFHIQEHMQQMQMMQALVSKFGSQPAPGGESEKDGGKGSEGPASSGAGGPSSMETMPGPLGNAMQSKRSGEIGGAPPQ
jgi:hypothetical protein